MEQVGEEMAAPGLVMLLANNGTTALSLIRERLPALAIVGRTLPGMSGLEVCRCMRDEAATANISVVILADHASAIDRINALELGADDYVSPPFSARELALRVKNILRRTSAGTAEPPSLEFGRIRLDIERH